MFDGCAIICASVCNYLPRVKFLLKKSHQMDSVEYKTFFLYGWITKYSIWIAQKRTPFYLCDPIKKENEQTKNKLFVLVEINGWCIFEWYDGLFVFNNLSVLALQTGKLQKLLKLNSFADANYSIEINGENMYAIVY